MGRGRVSREHGHGGGLGPAPARRPGRQGNAGGGGTRGRKDSRTIDHALERAIQGHREDGPYRARGPGGYAGGLQAWQATRTGWGTGTVADGPGPTMRSGAGVARERLSLRGGDRL